MNLIFRQQDYDNPKSLSSRFRRARARHIVKLIEAVAREQGTCRILDLGGRPDYWRLIDRAFLDASKVHITIVNLEEQPPAKDALFTQQPGDACALDLADNSFDIVHSNSVIEHVGDWTKMEQFAAETRRLGKRYFVQTPNYWFPIEPHFSSMLFHWAPETTRAQRLMKRGHGFMAKTDDFGVAMRAVQHARLLDSTKMRYLFPDAREVTEKIGGLTKSLMAIRE